MTMANLVNRGVVSILSGYRLILSPFLPPSCRFSPSCSVYALESVIRYGCWKGLWLSFTRLLRCHPFHRGGVDPVP